MEEKKETFEYTYSAPQQEEILSIREKYLPKEPDKMEQLRKLDRSVYQKAQAWSLSVGMIGTLVMGTGMSLAMSELGAALGSLAMPVGIVVGLIGMALAALAYPIYNRVMERERRRIAPEIIRLTDELMK